MKITQSLVEEYAPNADAAKNGRELARKGNFSNLKISSDRTLIWGECAGSGKNPYTCSADFMDEQTPVFRCNCPSRQIPCKHCIGLLYAFVDNESSFTEAPIPEDIVSKRGKIEKRQEKKLQEKESVKEKALKPSKKNLSAPVKKIDVQLTGIDIAKKMLNDLVQNGLSSIDAKVSKTLQNQIKELGNYYINGIQTAFNDLLLELSEVKNEEYTKVIDRINYIYALLKKATEYLNRRKENPEDAPELNSTIEEQIGTAWKLTELMQYGLWEANAEIIQLSFNTYNDPARKEWVDEGIWLNLKTGKIYKTNNYRPYKALKYVKADNTVPGVLKINELYIYPGDLNPRIRWEGDVASLGKRYDARDFVKVISYASGNYAETVKSVKNSIKNPLTDKHPVVLLALHKAYLKGDNSVIEDKEGNKLTLKDIDPENFSSATNLKNLLPATSENSALTVQINNDVQTGLLSAQPLSLITPQKIIRLLY
jgi:uncharacterized Zn finger protein